MIELFTNISSETKDRAKFIFDMAVKQKNLLQMVNTLQEYTETCIDEEEKAFVEFYFNLRFEELKNGSVNNQR